MTDLERLDEALDDLGDRDYLVPHDVEDAYGSWLEVTHAARAYRELLANGERVEWCEEHRSVVRHRWLTCLHAWFAANVETECRIVFKLLVDPPKEAMDDENLRTWGEK